MNVRNDGTRSTMQPLERRNSCKRPWRARYQWRSCCVSDLRHSIASPWSEWRDTTARGLLGRRAFGLPRVGESRSERALCASREGPLFVQGAAGVGADDLDAILGVEIERCTVQKCCVCEVTFQSGADLG